MMKMRFLIACLIIIALPLVSYGTNVSVTSHTFGPKNTPATDVKIADLSGDGQNDSVVLAVGRHAGGQSLICNFNNDSGQFACNKKIGFSNSPTIGVAVGDFYGDGDPDIILANGDCHYSKPQCQNRSAAILLRHSDDYKKPIPLVQSKGARSLATGDINDNGLQDILLGFAGGQDNLLLLNQGGGQFKKVTFPNLGAATLGMTTYDNTNGRDYIVTTSRAPWRDEKRPHKNAVYQYNEGQLKRLDEFGQNLQSVDAVVGQLDKSKQNYVVVTNGGEPNKPGQVANIWPISANGQVASKPSSLSQQKLRARPVLVHDITGNGLNDIIVGNLNEPFTKNPQSSLIYINQGDLKFDPIKLPNTQLMQPRGMDIGEIDGQLYLFSANYCYKRGHKCFSTYYNFKVSDS